MFQNGVYYIQTLLSRVIGKYKKYDRSSIIGCRLIINTHKLICNIDLIDDNYYLLTSLSRN